MKKGQKSTRGGYQDILFPMTYMNITQGNNGQFSHRGVNALDLAGKDTGRDLFYAPFDVECVATGNRDTEGNAAFWQSCKKVRFADGTIDYATIMVLHDNSLAGIYPGATYTQGTQIGQEGTAGYATGNHNHFEIAKGKFNHKYDQNKYGVYHLPNSISADKCCFIDGTTVLNGNGMKWKKLADVKVSAGSKPAASTKKPDQILTEGSVVESVAMRVTAGIKKISGDDCINVPALGGYFPLRFLNEYDASDGKLDQIISNDKAKVTVAQTTVQKVDKAKNLVMIHGIWVNAEPLTEIKDGK